MYPKITVAAATLLSLIFTPFSPTRPDDEGGIFAPESPLSTKFGLTDLLGDNARFSVDLSHRSIHREAADEWSYVQFYGVDALKTFSSKQGDWATLNLQFYWTDPKDQSGEWITRITNFNYTGLANGQLNFKVGHFEMPYGLDVAINTNGTLRQLNTVSNLRIKADWGLSVNGVLPTLQYEVALTNGIGNGQDIDPDTGSYIVSGRVGSPLVGESFAGENFYGASFFYGEVKGGDGELVERSRFGVDAATYLGPFTVLGEASIGQEDGDDVINAFAELNFVNSDESVVPYTQLKSLNRKIEGDWDDTLSSTLGLRFTPDNFWAFSAQVSHNWESELTDVSAQARLRF